MTRQRRGGRVALQSKCKLNEGKSERAVQGGDRLRAFCDGIRSLEDGERERDREGEAARKKGEMRAVEGDGKMVVRSDYSNGVSGFTARTSPPPPFPRRVSRSMPTAVRTHIQQKKTSRPGPPFSRSFSNRCRVFPLQIVSFVTVVGGGFARLHTRSLRILVCAALDGKRKVRDSDRTC